MNTNIHNITILFKFLTNKLKNDLKIKNESKDFIFETRENIQNIYDKKSNKLIVIIGPRSSIIMIFLLNMLNF